MVKVQVDYWTIKNRVIKECGNPMMEKREIVKFRIANGENATLRLKIRYQQTNHCKQLPQALH